MPPPPVPVNTALATNAVTEAARLPEIGFGEFTTNLITDVFRALIDANTIQTQSYVDLLQAASGTLADFISRTEGAVNDDQRQTFLAKLGVPPLTALPGTGLTLAQATAVNSAVKLPAAAAPAPGAAAVSLVAGTPNAATISGINGAIAKRIAADQFELLQQMVRQGMIRLVVDSGVIETRLTFHTYGSSRRASNTSERNINTLAGGGGGFATIGVLNVGGGAAGSSIKVSTAKTSDRDVSGSSVQIFGRVELRFKTDFVPLNQ